MPQLDIDEIKSLISKNGIYALTLDTSVFDRYGNNLDHTALRALDQFKHGQIKVILSIFLESPLKLP